MSCNARPPTDARLDASRPHAGPATTAGRVLSYVLPVLLAIAACLPSAVTARTTAPDAPEPAPSRSDSLRRSIEVRLQRISALRDSLSTERGADLDAAIEDLGSVFDEIQTQLRDIDVTVDDEMLKFTSPDGELSFDIPENWGDKVSQGLSAITATILAELPDSLDIERGLDEFRNQADAWRINIFDEESDAPAKQKVVSDQIISTGDDVVVTSDERVAGSVIVFGADATIMGTVDETVFVLGGALNLGQGAVIHGDAVSLFGPLRRDEDASVDGTVVSVGGSGLGGEFLGLPDFTDGLTGVIIKLAGLIVLGLFILLVFALLPQTRLQHVEAYLAQNPGRSFAAGLL